MLLSCFPFFLNMRVLKIVKVVAAIIEGARDAEGNFSSILLRVSQISWWL